ncbi:MAG: phosphonate ABC transporter, permease protein PhnE [Cetobacterium sp.]
MKKNYFGKIKIKDHKNDKFLNRIILSILVLFLFSFFKINLDFYRISRGIGRLGSILSEFGKPDLTIFKFVLIAVWESFEIAFIATLVGMLFSLPLSFLAASNTTPSKTLSMIIKAYLSFIRAVPSLIWAVIFVSSIGLGPFSGILGLSVHTVSYLTKAYLQSIEDLGDENIIAIKSTGASWINIMKAAVIPNIKKIVTGWTALRFESNMAQSSIIGVVGAGGIGYIVSKFIKAYDFNAAGTALLTLITISVFVEVLGTLLKNYTERV